METLFEIALKTETADALKAMAADVMPLQVSLNSPSDGIASISPMAALSVAPVASISPIVPSAFFSSKRNRKVYESLRVRVGKSPEALAPACKSSPVPVSMYRSRVDAIMS